MRGFINMVEDTSHTVTLLDLYTPSELSDESEQIAHYAPPMDWETPLTVHTMPVSDVPNIEVIAGTKIIDAYKAEASMGQKKIVGTKVRDFDPSRIVVLFQNTVVDGNHHIVAAIQSNLAIQYVDLSELD